MLGEVLQSVEKPERTVGKMKQIAAGVARELRELRRGLENVPYPFRHAREGLDLGAFLVPETPAETDLGAAFDAANKALNHAVMTGARIWGRIAATTEKVEQELGLAPLETPAEENAEAAA